MLTNDVGVNGVNAISEFTKIMKFVISVTVISVTEKCHGVDCVSRRRRFSRRYNMFKNNSFLPMVIMLESVSM